MEVKRLDVRDEQFRQRVQQSQEVENSVLSVGLAAEDVEPFSQFTTENVGEQVLFMVDDVPVYTFHVLMPISMGRIRITCGDQRELQLLRDNLARLLPPK